MPVLARDLDICSTSRTPRSGDRQFDTKNPSPACPRSCRQRKYPFRVAIPIALSGRVSRRGRPTSAPHRGTDDVAPLSKTRAQRQARYHATRIASSQIAKPSAIPPSSRSARRHHPPVHGQLDEPSRRRLGHEDQLEHGRSTWLDDDVVINEPGNVTITHSTNAVDSSKSVRANDPITLSGGTLSVTGSLSDSSRRHAARRNAFGHHNRNRNNAPDQPDR